MTPPAWKAVTHTCPRAIGLVFCLCLAAALTAGMVSPTLAQEFELPQELDENAPWLIEADKLVGLHDAQVVEAEGNVVLRQGPNYLQADFARYYRDTQWVYLEGNVRAGLGGDEIEAESAEFDLANKVGWLTNGRIFLVDPHIYFTGETIHKSFGDTYSFENAYVTACDSCPAAWSFSADEGEVTIDGYAELRGTSFNILGQPVAYLPYMIMPAKTTRQSGLLFPELGYTKHLGFFMNLPIYVVIDEENDITFYEYVMSQRGFMQGVEYRNQLSLETRSLIRFDYIFDQEIAREERQENSPLNRDGLVRSNHSRYWLRGMVDADLPAEWKLKLNLDFTSDQNYLREFNAGLSGFNRSKNEFLDEFSRTIAENDQNRTSELLLTRDFGFFAVAGSIEWNQSTAHGHGNETPERDPSLQRVPELTAYLFQDRIPGIENFPLELAAEAQYTYFWRQYGTRGHRLDLTPTLSMPLVCEYGSIIPTVIWRNTLWDVDDFKTTTVAEGDDNIADRSLPMFDVEAFTELYRVWDLGLDEPFPLTMDSVGNSRTAAIKHAIQPRIEYSGVPHVEQRDMPYFDDMDRIEEQQELTYSLTNVITAREETVVMGTDEDGSATPALEVGYEDVVRLTLEQSYDFNEATREDSRQYDRRPLSDIRAEVTIHYDEYLSLTSRTWYSVYEHLITEHEHTLRAEVPDMVGAQVSFDFQHDIDEFKRQNRQAISILRTQAWVHLLYGLSLDLQWDYDMSNEVELNRGLGVNFQHQCFDVHFNYSRSGLDERFEAWVNLVGFNLF